MNINQTAAGSHLEAAIIEHHLTLGKRETSWECHMSAWAILATAILTMLLFPSMCEQS